MWNVGTNSLYFVQEILKNGETCILFMNSFPSADITCSKLCNLITHFPFTRKQEEKPGWKIPSSCTFNILQREKKNKDQLGSKHIWNICLSRNLTLWVYERSQSIPAAQCRVYEKKADHKFNFWPRGIFEVEPKWYAAVGKYFNIRNSWTQACYLNSAVIDGKKERRKVKLTL